MTSGSPDTKPGKEAATRIPVLLLKTKSTPNDAYEDIFTTSSFADGAYTRNFDPSFVPVLLHQFDDGGIRTMSSLLQAKEITSMPGCRYGGMIFTSQRAVEAFAQVVHTGKVSCAGESAEWPFLQNVPIYSVGPATTRALRAIQVEPPLQIFGEHTGNGEALAEYIQEHYGQWYGERESRPPLLFLVGEQRRDIIPRSLMDPGLAPGQRIQVDEEVVYGTGVMQSFSGDFAAILKETRHEPERWVVVFSPTGCDSMLRELGLLDQKCNKAKMENRDGKTFIATIGPTTRSYLMDQFGFEPDVCADSPSPDGILQGIAKFSSGRI